MRVPDERLLVAVGDSIWIEPKPSLGLRNNAMNVGLDLGFWDLFLYNENLYQVLVLDGNTELIGVW